ncbi:MAG: DNA translocase FtsK 4TM domain-containing protein, partial [Gammaproteobacteria bacterium]
MARAAGIRGRRQSAGASAVVYSAREAALWVLAALAVIMLVALLTYDARDPGFSHTGDGAPVRNQIGTAGAWFSDVTFGVFGTPAYLFPLMVMLSGWFIYAAKVEAGQVERKVLATRLAGFLTCLAASCGLATLHFHQPGLPQSAGGALGEMIAGSVGAALGGVGATLMLLALWLASVSLFTGVSWLAVMDRIGATVLTGVDRVREFAMALREKSAARRAQEQRQEVVKRQRRKTERKKAPRIEPVLPAVETGERVEKERQVTLFDSVPAGELPPLSLLDAPPDLGPGYSDEALEAMSRLVEMKLRDFGVEVEVVSVHPGPVVTRFELDPAAGVKVSQISNLAKDLARSLSTISVRVVEVIPGKSTVGLEIPNETRELVTLGEIIRSQTYEKFKSPLTLGLGKD